MSNNLLEDPRAGTYEGWIRALTIFAKYNGKGLEGYAQTSAEHDVIYFEGPAPVTSHYDEDEGETICEWGDEVKADAAELDGLGFHWDTEVDSWAKFT